MCDNCSYIVIYNCFYIIFVEKKRIADVEVQIKTIGKKKH